MSGKCKKRESYDREEKNSDSDCIDLIYNFESISNNTNGGRLSDVCFFFEFFAQILFVYCCQYLLTIYWLAKTNLDGVVLSSNDTDRMIINQERRQRTRGRGSQHSGGDAGRQQRQHQPPSTNVNIRPAAAAAIAQPNHPQPGRVPFPICLVSYHLYLQTFRQFAHLVGKQRIPFR